VIRLHSFVNRAIFGRTEIKIPVEIKFNSLEKTENNLHNKEKPFYIVNDPDAELNQVFSVDSSLFSNDRVIVNYTFGQRFYISLLKEDGTIIDRSFIFSCRPFQK
jgi:hypothetical protein